MNTECTTATADTRILVSVKEAGRMLGLLPWPTLKLVDSGQLPSGRLNDRIVIHVDDVRAFARAVTV